MTRSSDSTRDRDSTANAAVASSSRPDTPNRSLIGTCTPAPASTAWIWQRRPERSPTSLARCRTQPRSSRVAGGAIHASGSRPIRSRSARSAASRSSFFTRRSENIFTPNGCARCTVAPSSARVSAAQYHPYAASSTTSGASPARVITSRRYSGSLEIRTVSRRSPVSVIRTNTLTAPMQIHPDDLPSLVCSAHRGLLESMDVSTSSMSRESRGAEAPPLHHINP